MRSTFSPFTTNADEGDWEWRGDQLNLTRRAVMRLAGPQRGGNDAVEIALARIPAGNAAPWHRHVDHEEFVYVISGAGLFWAEGQAPAPVAAGSVNLIPPHCWHCHTAGPEDLVFLWGYAPPGEQLTV